jgi:hypothetical protein
VEAQGQAIKRAIGKLVAAARAITILLLVVGSSACAAYWGDPLPERVDLVVFQAGDDIRFDWPTDFTPEQREAAVILGELTVAPATSENRPASLCIGYGQGAFWDAKGDSRRFKDSPVFHLPLQYGQTIANTVVSVPAKRLTAGRYRLCAGVAAIKDHFNGSNFTTLFAEFEIDGNLRLVR